MNDSISRAVVLDPPIEGGAAAGVPAKLTPLEWLICAVAALGFAFDLYETLMLPLIVRPVLTDLQNLRPGMPAFNLWVALFFYIPNVAGGVFGLIGGYLTDIFGRKRILICSILLYSFAACAGSLSTSLTQLLLFRCVTMIGISVEFVAAIAWLAELFPHPKRRESVLGFTQAFFAVGGLLVSGAYYLAVTYGEHFPTIYGAHEAWRYTLLSGLIPALPLLLARPFLPESPLWEEKREETRGERPKFREVLRPGLRKTTIVAILGFACTQALPFGAIQHTVRVVPGLLELQNAGRRQVEQTVSRVQMFQELGGLTGRMLFAVLVVKIASQRRRLRALLMPALIVFPVFYFFAATRSVVLLYLGIFAATMLFNGLHSSWGNYLPRVYPTRLRGIGESFAINVGGRVLGVTAALFTTTLSNVVPGAGPGTRLAYSAGTVSLLFIVLGLIGTFWMREPTDDRLPD